MAARNGVQARPLNVDVKPALRITFSRRVPHSYIILTRCNDPSLTNGITTALVRKS